MVVKQIMSGAAHVLCLSGLSPSAVDKSRNHKRTFLVAFLSLLITTPSFYIWFTLVLTGMVPFKNLNVDDAVAFALRRVGASWAGIVSLVRYF